MTRSSVSRRGAYAWYLPADAQDEKNSSPAYWSPGCSQIFVVQDEVGQSGSSGRLPSYAAAAMPFCPPNPPPGTTPSPSRTSLQVRMVAWLTAGRSVRGRTATRSAANAVDP